MCGDHFAEPRVMIVHFNNFVEVAHAFERGAGFDVDHAHSCANFPWVISQFSGWALAGGIDKDG